MESVPVWLRRFHQDAQHASPDFLDWMGKHGRFCIDLLSKVHGAVEKQGESSDLGHRREEIDHFKCWIQENVQALNSRQIESIKEETRLVMQESVFRLKEAHQIELGELAKRNAVLAEQMMNAKDLARMDLYKDSQLAERRVRDIEAQLNDKELLFQQVKSEHESQLRSIMENVKKDYEEKIGVFLSRYTSSASAIKGACGQDAYLQLLTETFPTYEVQETHATTRSCDLSLTVMPDNINILFEIKNFTTNVPSKDVAKFKRDIVVKQQHGVMVSQSTGIANKKDMEVEIVDKCVVVYLCVNKLNADAIKMAVQTILNLAPFLSQSAGATEDPETSTKVSQFAMANVLSHLNQLSQRNERLKADLRSHIASLDDHHIEQIKLLLTSATLK